MFLLALTLLAADPKTINSVLSSAKSGDTIRMVPGDYGALYIRSRTFDPPLTIDARDAKLTEVQIISSTGIRWTGGTFKGTLTSPIPSNHGLTATQSRNVTVDSVRLSDYKAGIVFDNVSGGTISGNWLSRMASDGIDLAASRNITVDRNACSEFMPAPHAHPDCIQAWSVSKSSPSSDLKITNNSIVGSMQGVSLYNHVRNGINDGGFDRVTISGNTVLNTYANGISVYDCRGCSVRNNSVSSLPSYIYRAQLYVSGGSVEQCGNAVAMVPRQSTPRCAA